MHRTVYSDTLAYVASSFDGVHIVDVSDPESLEYVSVFSYNMATDVHVSAHYLYVAAGYAGVSVVDVSDPKHPVEVAYSLDGYGEQLHIVEPYLYLAWNYSGLRILDIGVPDSIHEVGYYTGISTAGIYSDGDYIYVGTSLDGFFIFEFTPTGIKDRDDFTGNLPKGFALHQNYPNPFNPSTTITYEVPWTRAGQSHVTLTVYDVRGRRVKTLIDSGLGPGSHTVIWDGRNERGQSIPSGIYIYSLNVADATMTRKMILLQ